tara:strand:- start:94 stop:390 length:297 start_codon:yes stop_codon:yes gene_type:complete
MGKEFNQSIRIGLASLLVGTGIVAGTSVFSNPVRDYNYLEGYVYGFSETEVEKRQKEEQFYKETKINIRPMDFLERSQLGKFLRKGYIEHTPSLKNVH